MKPVIAPALMAALVALPAPVLAQAYQCTPPARVVPADPPQPDGPARRMAIAGYSLMASWSPEYCRARGDAGEMQCSRRNGRFGFVLHGLWPEGRTGWPQWCSTAPRPSPQVLRRHLCMTPSPRLLEHEWAKHGSCMTSTPDRYFRASAALWNSLRWPDADALSRKSGLTAGDFRQAFVAINPSWKPDMIGIVTSRSGWLRELRLCYGRDFMPAACQRRQLGPGDAAPLKIWRGL